MMVMVVVMVVVVVVLIVKGIKHHSFQFKRTSHRNEQLFAGISRE
jgi:hypothetical protein